MRECLVLTQYREDKKQSYNDFIGKFYHFPANEAKSYLSQFQKLPLEFVYYEPTANGGKGEFFGYGHINKKPFVDKREDGFYFVEISDYKKFNRPVAQKNAAGELIEGNSPHYNPQNSVRKIPSELLDEICLDGEIILNFQADAHLIKVLGEQLIASEKVGILELIKNAYDAGATQCTVRIENIPPNDSLKREPSELTHPNLVGPVIIIEDNGCGMSRHILENGWLRPAATLKTNVKEKLKEERKRALEKGTLDAYERLFNELKVANGNRIPLGEKGVGRFATHRLGKRLIIKTKTAQLSYEHVLEIDWDVFDKYSDTAVDLSSIGISLKKQPPSKDYGPRHSGTQIIVYSGREEFTWTEEKIRELNRSILELNSPNPHPNKEKTNFSVELIVPQVQDLEREFFSEVEPTFELVGVVDNKGVFEYELTFTPPKSVPMGSEHIKDKLGLIPLCKTHWLRSNENTTTDCGPFYVHLKLWYRKPPFISGPNGDNLTEYLDRHGGISIYRDGINIFPAEWGAKNDWLGLLKKHIKQGWRLSYYNMIGNIEIDQGSNIALTDKTDRQGLIENGAYEDLVVLMQAVIDIVLMNAWSGKRDEYTSLTKDIIRNPKALHDYTKQSSRITKNIIENYPFEEDEYGLLEGLGPKSARKDNLVNLERSMKELQKSLELIQEQQDMLTEQAGYGLAIAVSVHEIAKITSNFYYGISGILKKEKIDKEKLIELKESSSSLSAELKRLSPLRAVKSEKSQVFDISKPIKYALDIYANKFKELNIKVSSSFKNDFKIYGRYGVIIQMFTNLIDNACYWLENADEEAREIKIEIDNKDRTIIFADTGPGVHASMLPHLFQAGYSMKVPRSGLGLYICKFYMHDMNGDIQLLTHPKHRLKGFDGAQFLLDFHKVPQEKK